MNRIAMTLVLVAVAAGKGLVEKSGLAPEEDVAPVAARIDRGDRDLMIVGHQPFLGLLAARLLTGKCKTDPIAFQRGGVLCLDRPAEDGPWQVAWMFTPALLEA